MYDFELTKVCHKLLDEILGGKPGETVAITCDTKSSMDVVNATAAAAVMMGMHPLVLQQETPRGVAKAGDIDTPVKPLAAAIANADIWIEYDYMWKIYSTVYDIVTQRPASERPRYICLNGANPELLMRNIGRVDLPTLKEFMWEITNATKAGKHFHITSPAGTDLTFTNSPLRNVDCSCGDIQEPGKIDMMPGQIGWCPEFDSINGVMVVDGALTPPLGKLNEPVKLKIEKGFITEIYGEGNSHKIFADWLKSYNDPGMYRLAHICYGFGPGALLSGDIVEDERVWGCTEWGFGNISDDMLPDIPGGLPAATHSDGINLNCSVWIDGVQILDKGNVVGPTPYVVELAAKLGK